MHLSVSIYYLKIATQLLMLLSTKSKQQLYFTEKETIKRNTEKLKMSHRK